MRLEFDENGYVCSVLFGCISGSCVEYTGLVPEEPEKYADLDDWADRAQVQAYYLDDLGNLIYDAERAAALPAEDSITPYTAEYCEERGIAPLSHKHTVSNISDIACNYHNRLQIGKTTIMWGSEEGIPIKNSTGSYGTFSIDYTDAQFVFEPYITVTPYCERDAAAPYGIMTYIRNLTNTTATIRATSNYAGSDLTVGIHWMAIGIAK